MKLTLKPYQIEDVAFLSSKNTAGCFNQQRTGKTPTIISVLKEKGCTKNLIVCPASLLYQWKEEYEKWTQEKCIVLTGTPSQKITLLSQWTHGLVVSYDSLKSTKKSNGTIDLILKENPDSVILDEAHRIKNVKSANFKACHKLIKIPIRYVLTGTPAPNKPEEIFAPLHIIDPIQFTSYWKFIDRFMNKKLNRIGPRQFIEIDGFQKGKQIILQQYLNEHCTSRKRKDIMQWLPEKDYQRIYLPATTQQRKYLSELSDYFETEHIMTKGVLDRLIRYRQICLDPGLLELKGKSPKTEWILQYLKDYPEKSVIIFSKFTSYLLKLANKLIEQKIDYGLIIGDINLNMRKKYVDQFQQGKLKLLLINIDAGKEGLTLDEAETTIFTDKYPPIGDIEQAEDRFVATSEDKANKLHTIIELCIKDTYDEQLYELLQNRKAETDVINDFKKYIGGNK